MDFETRFIESIMEIISLTKPVEGLSAISAEARVRQTPSLAPIPHSSNTDIQNWGAIIPQRTTNLFFRQLSEELLRLAGGANPRVILYGLSDRDSSDTVTDALDLCKTFKSLNCSGIFFVPFEYDSKSLQNNDTIVDEIERNMRGTELVLLDRGLRRYPDTSNFDVVRLDNLVAGQKLLDGLRERILHRCRKRKPRIVFIHRPNSADSAELRLLGINAALERHGLESIRRGAQNGSRVVVGNPSDQGFLESQNLEEADAVICPNDVTAQVVNEFLEKLPVSKRPLLAGFDGVVSPAKWYSVPQPTAQIAMVAWTIMRMRMLRPNENYKGSVTVLVQPGPVREPAK